jgi:membrane protein DedA with SNARE-associated domain
VLGSIVLPGFLATLAPLLDRYGYLAVAALLLLEDFGLPAPGETVLIAAAVYAGAGQFNIVAVGVVGFVAAVLGDNLGYTLGRLGGRRLVLRFGRYVLLTPARLSHAEWFFGRHGGKIVTVARFIEGLRQANGIVAGITRMRWWAFLGYNALGAALWVGLWVSLGDLAGAHIEAIYTTAHRYQTYLALAAALLLLAALTWHLLRRRAHGGAAETDHTAPLSPEKK